MNFEVRTISNFDRELKKLLKKFPSVSNDLLELTESLKTDPLQGDHLGRNCYKVRMRISSKGKGKSGGSRIITCVKIINECIYLMSIYDKSDQSSVSDNFLMQLLADNNLL